MLLKHQCEQGVMLILLPDRQAFSSLFDSSANSVLYKCRSRRRMHEFDWNSALAYFVVGYMRAEWRPGVIEQSNMNHASMFFALDALPDVTFRHGLLGCWLM